MEKIVLASGNAKKLAEMQRLLEPLDIQVVAQSEFSVPEAEETGTTFVGKRHHQGPQCQQIHRPARYRR